MAKLINRKYQPGDEAGIVDIYNKITNRNRTVAQHRWEWKYAFQNPISSWVIIKQDTNEIVGHHGLLPFNLNYFGKTILMGKTENTVLHPNYLGSGIYFLHERKFFQEAKQQFDILLTVAGHGVPGKIRQKLGYKPVGYYTYFVKICGIFNAYRLINQLLQKKFKNKFLNLLAANILNVPMMFVAFMSIIKFPKRDKTLTITKIDNFNHMEIELETFFNRNEPLLGISAARTIKFLKWRLLQNPYTSHRIFLARKNNKIFGYIIGSFNHKTPFATVVDIVAADNNPSIFNSLIHALSNDYSKQKVSLLVLPTVKSKNFLNQQLKKSGFITIDLAQKIIEKLQKFFKKLPKLPIPPSNTQLLIATCNHNLDARLYASESWYFTGLLLEGLEERA